MSETPAGGNEAPRETFAETLTAVADAARERMRPTPLAEIGALNHRRRRRRATWVMALTAVSTCAVAVGVAVGAGPGVRKAPLPPVGPTPTVARTTSSSAAATPPTASPRTSPAAAPPTSPGATTASTAKPAGTAVADSSFLAANQVPFPDGAPWQAPAPDSAAGDLAVTDVCVSAWDPVPTRPAEGSTTPVESVRRLWPPGNTADVSPAAETVHLFGSTADALAAYQKTKALYRTQTCHPTGDTVGTTTLTITPGGKVDDGTGGQGFAIGASNSYEAAPTTGTFNQFRTYVVLKGSTIAVLSVPVTKENVSNASGDTDTLTALLGRLP